MKKFLFISLNLILISFIAFLVFKNPGITGFAIVEDEEMLVKYIASVELNDIDSGNSKTARLGNKDIYFYLDEDKGFEMNQLVFLEEKGITTDADDNESVCSEKQYITKRYFIDLNRNSLPDNEPEIYSARTDKDGCVAAILPKKDYRLMFG